MFCPEVDVITCYGYHSNSYIIAIVVDVVEGEVLIRYSSSMDNPQSCAHLITY